MNGAGHRHWLQRRTVLPVQFWPISTRLVIAKCFWATEFSITKEWSEIASSRLSEQISRKGEIKDGFVRVR